MGTFGHLWGWGTYGHLWVLVLVLDDPPEAPAQPEGDPENEGLPTATGRFTRSRPKGSKRAARGSTPSHRGPTLAGFHGAGGDGGTASVGGRGAGGGARKSKGAPVARPTVSPGAQSGAAQGRRLGLRRRADWGCDWGCA